jgi:glycosyltransferase involved in cell wall biosynthesis
VRPRIVIDALAARLGGTAQLAIQVAQRLARDSSLEEVVVVTRRRSMVARGLRPAPGLRLVTLRPAHRLELPRRVAWQALGLPGLTPPGTRLLTFSGMLPRRSAVPVVSHLSNALMFERGDAANRLRRRVVRRTALAAGSQVVVPTRGQADLVRAAIGVQAHVVPHGTDHAHFSPAPEPGHEVLCVSDLYRHKRHDLVLAAWTALPEPRPPLRFIGDDRVDPDWAGAICVAARTFPGVTVERGLTRSELVRAYRRARVFVLASESESFSLPLLEAQACGVPAVVRDIPALRETGGPATTYVTGDDPAEWAKAIAHLLEDAPHAERRDASLAHAAQYDWDKTVAAIRQLLGP